MLYWYKCTNTDTCGAACQLVTEEISKATGHLPGFYYSFYLLYWYKRANTDAVYIGVTIAVMGCIVNGPGEMADADFGYVGGAPGLVKQVLLY